MPAVSKEQQKAMCMALAARKGDLKVKDLKGAALEIYKSDMTDEQIEGYISTDEPYDKAGAYGIQGMFGVYVKGIHGDYNNVVGLPIARLYQALMNYNLV